MSGVSRLGRQITELLESLEEIRARFALIGGLALAPQKVVRATQDIDLLADAQQAEAIDGALQALGYRCLHRNADAANYLRGDERVDLLYAHRPLALKLLGAAQRLTTPLGVLPVISVEGFMAFKLQGRTNDPRRTQDLEDIRALFRANRATLDLAEAREYFRLFGREALLQELLNEPTNLAPQPLAESAGGSRSSSPPREPFESLDDLMAVVEALCPRWPERSNFVDSGTFVL